MAKFRGLEKKCEICGKQFKVSPSRADARFCSRKCKSVWWSQRRDKTVTLACKRCGKSFDEYASLAPKRSFCSRKCSIAGQSAARSARFMGAGNPRWKGGKSMHADGYVMLCGVPHPSVRHGRVLEHRMVMEKWLLENAPESPFLIERNGVKFLSPDVIVHHKNENKTDNRIENLECKSQSEHLKSHRNDPDYIRKQIAALQRKLKLLTKE